MTTLRREEPILDLSAARALVGRLTRPDGQPVSRSALYRLVDRGLPKVRILKAVTFRESAIRRWMQQEGVL